MYKTIIKSLKPENAEIHAVSNGSRFLLARCNATLDIIESKNSINTTDGATQVVSANRQVTLRCADIDTTRNADDNYLMGLSGFDFVGDIQRKDGVFKRFNLNVLLEEVDRYNNEWVFHINATMELLKELTDI
jgi:hypothetical protein